MGNGSSLSENGNGKLLRWIMGGGGGGSAVALLVFGAHSIEGRIEKLEERTVHELRSAVVVDVLQERVNTLEREIQGLRSALDDRGQSRELERRLRRLEREGAR